MASSSFRDSMSSLGWSRRDEQQPLNTRKQGGFLGSLGSLNPFNAEGGGNVRLPIHENEGPGAPLPAQTRREEEEAWFALSRWDRLLIFGGLNLVALALFAIGFTLLPFLALKLRKFVILWTMASALFLSSWAVLMGPLVYARHLVSPERLPFTSVYFGSIGLTLFFAIGLKSTILTLPCAIIQIVALVWYMISYFPMGSQGLRMAASFGGSRVANWMQG